MSEEERRKEWGFSTAIAGNLYHPNRRQTMSTFFEGINEEPELMDKSERGKAMRKHAVRQ